MPRTNKKYEPEFKIKVIEDLRENELTFSAAAKKYEIYTTVNQVQYPNKSMVKRWERQYLEKGRDSFFIEHRGRGSKGKGRKPNFDQKIKEDLIAENQRLRMENAYLKKLSTLVSSRERKEKKSHK